MQDQKGNEKSQSYRHEEWQAGNSGCLFDLRNQDVPHRQESFSQRLTANNGGFHAGD
jgi:hypothetical protein